MLISIVSILIFTQVFSQKLELLSPKESIDSFQDGIYFGLGNIGHVPYGQTLEGIAFIASDQTGCYPQIKYPQSQNFFLVAKRGECHFVTKATYAQKVGASMVIIVDNKQENEQEIVMQSNLKQGKMMVWDTNQLFLLSLFKKQLDLINKIQYYNARDTNIMLRANFEMEQRKNIDIKMYINFMHRESFHLVSIISDLHKKSKDNAPVFDFKHIKVLPIFQIYNGQKYSNTIQKNYCIGNGRYCQENQIVEVQSFDEKNPFDTSQFMMIKSICVFKEDEMKFYKFMDQFERLCIKQQMFNYCANQILKALDIIEKVESCVQSSYETANMITKDDIFYEKNLLLEQNQRDFYENKVSYWPALLINGQEYRGVQDRDGISEAICAAYEKHSKPKFCEEVLKINYHESSTWKFVKPILFVMLFFYGLTYYLYVLYTRRTLKNDMSSQVNQMVSQYVSFYESKQNESQL